MNDINDKLIYILQKGLPLEARPFAAIAKECDLSETEIIGRVKELQDSGLIRRFGGVFNSESLGFKSCLCAVDIPEFDLERVNSIITPDLGVTHCYIRDAKPDLWFTYTAHKSKYDDGLNKFKSKLAPYELLVLPVVKRFKIQVIFDKCNEEQTTPLPQNNPEILELSEREKQLVSYLQGNVPITPNLYKEIAKEVNYEEKELIEILSIWKEKGALKRVSCIIRHRLFGFKGNAMCVWKVPEENIDELGAKLAERSDISHCYQREMKPEFPYNFYVMLHGKNEGDVLAEFNSISESLELGKGKILFSRKELKKTSPVYFKHKMNVSVYIMSVIVFLLVTGAFPFMGVQGIYKSAFMLILFGLLSILTLICCFKQFLTSLIPVFNGGSLNFRFKKVGFYLSHLGAVVILSGAFIGFLWGKKVAFGVRVGNQHVVDKLIDQRKPDEAVNLDYSFFITDFKVEKFDPDDFSLYKRDEQSPDGFQLIKKYNLIEGKIILDKGLGKITENELKSPMGKWIPHYFINEDYVLIPNQKDKWYSAKFNVIDGDLKKQLILEVNNPVSYRKWRFYLISYGQDRYGDYLLITARKDPGRLAVISGIWMLIIGIFIICFFRKK